MDGAGKRRRRAASRRRLDEEPHLVFIEAAQRYMACFATERAQHIGNGRALAHVHLAIRAEQQDARGDEIARQELQE